MKINILGASGSGVTTVGTDLSKSLDTPYLDSDDYFWEKTDPPFTSKRDPAKRNDLINKELSRYEHWILGGSVMNWNNPYFDNFELIVFLWIPPEIRIERLRQREFERYGEALHSNPEIKKISEDFLEWAADYDNCTGLANRNINAHNKWLESTSIPVLKIEGDLSTEERIRLIKRDLFSK